MSEKVYDFADVPTLQRFVLDNSPMSVVMGPFGSGKSTACVMKMMLAAKTHPPGPDGVRRTRFAVIRNTFPQLRDTARKTFFDWVPEGVYGRFRESTFTYHIAFEDVECEVLFRALDKEGAERQLLSLELTGAWVNEAKEIRGDVIQKLRGRVSRYPAAADGGGRRGHFGVFMDTNPPVVGSWLWAMMEGMSPDETHVPKANDWQVYKQPSGLSDAAENLANLRQAEDDADPSSALRPGRAYYEDMLSGASEEFIKTFVHGEYGSQIAGQPVHRGFSATYHVSQRPLRALEDDKYPLVIGMDCGRSPAAVVCQSRPFGRVYVLDEVVGQDMGAAEFVRTLLRPKISERFAQHTVAVFIDPAGGARSQVDDSTVLDVLRKAGLWCRRAKTNSIEARLRAVDDRLAQQAEGGKPALWIDPRCHTLKAALGGGYAFKDSTRARAGGELDKNRFSHVAEALQYAMLHVDSSRGMPLRYRSRAFDRQRTVTAGSWT